MSGDELDPQSTPRPAWASGRFIAAAALLVGIAGVGVVLTVTGHHPKSPAAGASATPTAAAPTAATADGQCEVPTGSQAIPVEAPETSWTLADRFAVPTAQDGPGLVESDGLRRCYAHSPWGAVLAAANFMAQAGDPDLQTRVVTELGAPSRARDTALAQAETEAADPSAPIVQLAGFRVRDYWTDGAVLDLLLRSSAGGLSSVAFEMTWSGDDWLVVFPATGWTPSPETSTAGFVAWSGVA